MTNIEELNKEDASEIIKLFHAKKGRENLNSFQNDERYADRDEAFWKRVNEEYDFGEFLYDLDTKNYYIDLEDDRYIVGLKECKLGAEGGGEDIWAVFSISDAERNERYFQVSGYYGSWDGSDWSDWEYSLTEVVPEEKVTIFWNPKK